jgi:hypothetical protein
VVNAAGAPVEPVPLPAQSADHWPLAIAERLTLPAFQLANPDAGSMLRSDPVGEESCGCDGNPAAMRAPAPGIAG